MPGILVCEARLISENPRNLRFRLFSIRPPAFAKRSAERVCFQVGSLRAYLIEMAYLEVSDILRGERPRNVAQAQREVMEGHKVA